MLYRQLVKLFALIAASLVGSAFYPVYGAEFASLMVGQSIPPGTLEIGRFKVKLPDGNWIVASKAQRTGTSGTGSRPTMLSLFVAQVSASKVDAIITITTPAFTFNDIRQWNDDPCRVEGFLLRDTSNGNFRFPDCLFVKMFASSEFATSAGYYADAASWLSANGSQIPERLYRVHYSKYHGGDFLLLNGFVPATASNLTAMPPTVEAWGRSAGDVIRKVVTGNSAEAALPTMPIIVESALK